MFLENFRLYDREVLIYIYHASIICAMEGATMPVNDPWLDLQRRWQRFLVISIVLLSICLPVYIVSLFLPTFNISLKDVSSVVCMGGIFVFAILSFLSQRNALKRHTQQHQRMVAGDANLLAQEQPSPNGSGLSLPTKIALCPKRATINWIYGILGFMALFDCR